MSLANCFAANYGVRCSFGRLPNFRRLEMAHDPLTTLMEVHSPVLLIYGSHDPWIPVERSLERLRASVESRPNRSAIVIRGADHSMMLHEPPEKQIDPKFFPEHRPDSAAYIGHLVSWLTGHGLLSWKR